ncbi:UNVERIFIED_CONTAM: hypothetical protein HDU68_012831 [Siphonaria sp. JEL0065]|nr:hypothetical protein HDU68_012831 [Siphonaria sp. JEL0065]
MTQEEERQAEAQPLLFATPAVADDATTEAEPETLVNRARRLSAPAVEAVSKTLAPLLSLRVSGLDALRILAPTMAVFLAVLYYIYIPLRLQGGAIAQTENGPPPALLGLNVTDVNGDGISFSVLATQTMGELSPLNLNLSPTRFHFESVGDLSLPLIPKPRYLPWPHRIPADYKDDDKEFNLTPTPLLGFQFTGFQVPAHAEKVNISVVSKVDALNDAFLDPFLTSTIKYLVDLSNYERNASNAENGVEKPVAPAPVTLRHRFTPTFWFPMLGFWKWDIPMWQYHRVDLSKLPPADNNSTQELLNKLNVTVDHQNVDTVPIRVPGHKIPVLVYVLNFTLSFTDPTDGVFRLSDIGTSVYLTIAHKAVDMLKIHAKIPQVEPGRNVGGLKVNVQSVAENGGTQALMDWFGLYAEGIDTTVFVHSLGFDYAVKLGDGRMGWIERMINKWAFDVFVPGAVEENEFWLNWGWLTRLIVKAIF